MDSSGSDILLPEIVGVLLVDSDSLCLTILSKMLLKYGYKGKQLNLLVFLFYFRFLNMRETTYFTINEVIVLKQLWIRGSLSGICINFPISRWFLMY